MSAPPEPARATDSSQDEIADAKSAQARRWRLLRRPTAACFVFALPFIAGCFGALVLTILYNWPDLNWVVYYFTVRPAFVWFGGLVPCLALGFFAITRRWFLIGCLVWILCLFASEEIIQCFKLFPGGKREDFQTDRMAFRTFMDYNADTVETASVPLRIVTWNVLRGKVGAERAVKQLEGLDADIIFMQEFVWGSQSEMRAPLKASPYFAAWRPVTSRNPVLSRLPIERIPAPGLNPWHATAARVQIAPGMRLTCINVHLPTPELRTQLLQGWSRTGVRRAIADMRKYLSLVRDLAAHYADEGPVIIAGDFNLPGNYADLSILKDEFKDCFLANGHGWGKTARADVPVTRIDLILVPKNARVRYAAAVPTRSSDHRLTIAEIILPMRKTSVPAD